MPLLKSPSNPIKKGFESSGRLPWLTTNTVTLSTSDCPSYYTITTLSGSSGMSGTSGGSGTSGMSGTSGTGFNTLSGASSKAVYTTASKLK